MITFQTVADVTADRRIVLVLPPDVPLGKVELSVVIAVVEEQPTQPLENRGAPRPEALESADSEGEEEQPGESLSETYTEIRSETRAHPRQMEKHAPAPADMEDADEMLVGDAQPSPGPTRVADAPGLPAEGQAAEPPGSSSSSGRTDAGHAELAPGRAPAPANGARAKPAPAPPLQLSQVLGSYRLRKKLGQGRFGTVYVAYQASHQREVALKVLSPELAVDPDLVERFVQDAQRLARLRHPNLLECFEVGQALGYQFLALDYVDEGSTGTWLKKLGKFSVGDSLYILLACCEALQYAHELKVVHGDIKPDNVLLGKRIGVKVADAGLLRSHGGDFSLSRSAAGAESLFYLAPEQLRDGNPPDPRSDLYSLGCLLYVFLTGTAPFKGKTLADLIEAKERGTFKPARERNGDVPERLEQILDKLLAVQPEERYDSCAALILDLQALGLASKDLNFLRAAAAAPASAPAPTPAPAPAPREWQTHALEDMIEGYWYIRLRGPDGISTRVRKATNRQLLALIKKKAVDADTPVGRSRDGDFQALGSYPEFSSYLGKVKARKASAVAEHLDQMMSSLHQEAPKKSSPERARSRGRDRGSLRGVPLWPAVSKHWLLWSGAAAALLIAWLLIDQPMWFVKLRITIHQWFN
jgi:serine/threonine-protein kinase